MTWRSTGGDLRRRPSRSPLRSMIPSELDRSILAHRKGVLKSAPKQVSCRNGAYRSVLVLSGSEVGLARSRGHARSLSGRRCNCAVSPSGNGQRPAAHTCSRRPPKHAIEKPPSESCGRPGYLHRWFRRRNGRRDCSRGRDLDHARMPALPDDGEFSSPNGTRGTS